MKLDKETRQTLNAILEAHAIEFGRWVVTGIVEHPGVDFTELYYKWRERDEQTNI